MAQELNIRIAGQAGQGMQTIGDVLARMFKSSGLHIFANMDYMSRIRGGNNFFQLRVSDKPVSALRSQCDIIVALDKESAGLHKDNINASGLVILDRKKFNIPETGGANFNVPLYELAQKSGGSDIFVNTVACGLLAGITGLEFVAAREIISGIFAGKPEDVVKKNIDAAAAGFEFSKNNFTDQKFKLESRVPVKSLLMDGNQAIALAAIRAGCKFYSAYPMSPSTSIMNTLARYGQNFNIVVEQAEDEIAAINMIIGASFAGVRSACGTSGGGFALMTEGLSLAGMTETPIVVVDCQRPGPATGFPTRTEQADLNMLIHAGHGEFARAIYSPGTVEEAFYLTIKAFNTAEKYQIPVLIMTDQYLADSLRDIEFFDLNRIKVQRYIISKEESAKVANYKRYQFTDSGISPRAIPSWINDVIYADSDEHTEEGHITEDSGMRVKMVEKRFYKKMAGLSAEIEPPVVYNTEKADTVLLGFGSTCGVIREAVQSLGERFGCLHLGQVWPFPAQQVGAILKDKKNVLTVENNAAGQLAGLLKREAGITVNSSILRFDGRPFSLDELCDRVRGSIK